MPDIAALSVSVTADTSQFEAGLNRANQQVSGFGSQLAGIGGAAATAFAALGAGVAAGIGSAVKTAADFEKQLSAISAVSGATASELDGIRAVALQLGKDTSFSASEAAAGMEEMVKAGVSLGDVMNGAGRAALDLAAAGGLSVAESATIASNAMNVFSLKGSDMAHVADVIAGAANASAIDVHDFGFSLSAAGAVAATVGIGFEDLSTAIAVMGQSGLKGSDAGTSLKTMMLNLDPASKTARAAMKDLGLITAEGANQFFTAEGKAKSFAEIAGVLQTSLKGLTKEQQLSALQTIFGTDAVRAAAIMAKVGAEGFNTMAESMSHVTAQAVANERLNNLAGSIEKLKGSLETGAIILGSMFTPAIKTFVDQLTDGVNQGVEILEQLPDAWRTIGQVMAGEWEPAEIIHPFVNEVGKAAIALKAQFGPAVQAVSGFLTGTMAPAIQRVGDFFAEHTEFITGFVAALGTILGMAAVQAVLAAIGAAIALLVSPIGLVTAAITLLVAAWVGNWGGIRDALLQAWAQMQPVFAQLVDWLGTQIPPVLTWIATVGWPAFVTAAQAVGAFITTVLIPAFTQVVLWLGTNIPPVVTWITDTGWPALVTAGTAVSTFVTGTLIPGITLLVDWLGPKLQPVVTWISGTGWPALVTAGTAVGAMVVQVTQFFMALFVELEKREVFTLLGQIWETAIAIGARLVTAVINITTAVAALFASIVQLLDSIVRFLGQATGLTQFFADLTAKAQASISPVQAVAGAIQGFFGIIGAQLHLLKQFLDMLDSLGSIKMPSFNFGGGGTGNGSWQATTSGGFANNAERLEFVRMVAAKYGHDPETVARAAMLEGAGAAGPVGDGGKSFGALQAYTGGGQGNTFMQQTGLDPSDPNNEKALVEWQIRNLGQTGWTPFHGPSKAGFAPFQGLNVRGSHAPINKTMSGGMGDAGPLPPFMNETFEALPDYLQSLDTIQQQGTDTYTRVATIASEQGAALADSQTGAVQMVFSTYTDAAGDIVGVVTQQSADVIAATTTQSAGVIQQYNVLDGAVNASVQNTMTGVNTTLTDGAGNMITTVTTTNGEILTQYAALANGVILNTGAMDAGVTTSVTHLGEFTITTFRDLAGNVVSTTTDMSGQVVAQTVTTAAQVTQQWTTTSATVIETATKMGLEVVGQSRKMGDGLVTATKTSTGEMVSLITNAAGQVVGQFTNIVEAGKTVATGLDAAKKGLSSYADGLKGVGIVAAKAAEQLAEFNKQAGGGKAPEFAKGTKGSGDFAKKAAGGPVFGGVPVIVGDGGRPELFVPWTDGTILPSVPEAPSMSRSQMDGGGRDTARIVAALERIEAHLARPNLNVYGAGTEDVVRKVRRELERQDAEYQSLRGI